MNNVALMPNKKEKINIFYLLEAMCGALVPSLAMLDIDGAASLAFNASFLVVLAHFFYYICTQRPSQGAFKNFLIYLFMVAMALASVGIVTPGSMGFNYMKKFIIFCAVFLLMFVASEQKINKKTLNAIITIFYIMAVFFIIFFFFMGGSTKTSGQKYSTAITMGLSNPNLTGMWLGVAVFFVVMAMNRVKKFIFKIISIIFIALLVYMITITECRNALIALSATAIIYLIYKSKSNKKISNIALFVVVLLPLLFVGFYYSVLNTSFVDDLDFLISAGKNLTSRVHIWDKALNAIKGARLITGDYYEISDGSGASQLHNVSLDILSSYGVVAFIMCTVYLFKMMSLAASHNVKKANIGLICFIGVWLFGLGEAGFITGGSGMYLPACLLFAFAFFDYERLE